MFNAHLNMDADFDLITSEVFSAIALELVGEVELDPITTIGRMVVNGQIHHHARRDGRRRTYFLPPNLTAVSERRWDELLARRAEQHS